MLLCSSHPNATVAAAPAVVVVVVVVVAVVVVVVVVVVGPRHKSNATAVRVLLALDGTAQ